MAKERTWFCFYHIITFIIQYQVFFNKIAFFHFQMFGDPFQVRGFKTGRIIFATGGTFEAIDLTKSFLMQPGQLFQHFILIRPLQELLVFFLVICRFFLPVRKDLVTHLLKNNIRVMLYFSTGKTNKLISNEMLFG